MNRKIKNFATQPPQQVDPKRARLSLLGDGENSENLNEFQHPRYQADTCDVGVVGGVSGMNNISNLRQDYDLSNNPHGYEGVDSDEEYSAQVRVPVVSSNDLAYALQETESEKLDALHRTVVEMKDCLVTKEEFGRFLVRFEELFSIVKLASEKSECNLAESVFGKGTGRVDGSESLQSARMRNFCSVNHNGSPKTLTIPQSLVLRIEAATSKRGVVKEVLRYLHPDPNYFDKRTISGKTKRSSDSIDNVEPIPSLTVKFCIAVVNQVKPLDRSRYNPEVIKEELEKYDEDTMRQISRAVIDIRNDDLKKKKND